MRNLKIAMTGYAMARSKYVTLTIILTNYHKISINFASDRNLVSKQSAIYLSFLGSASIIRSGVYDTRTLARNEPRHSGYLCVVA